MLLKQLMKKTNLYQEIIYCMKINSDTTVQDIFDNIQYYIDLFLEQGILIFKELKNGQLTKQ
jgi:hypothetical protein